MKFKPILFAGLLYLWAIQSCTSIAEDASDWRVATLPIAQQQDIRSAATGQTYRIFISKPAVEPPPEGFPVIYVLDGNVLFYPVSMLVHGQSQRREATGITPAVVVGIGYPTQRMLDEVSRAEDLTPPAPDLSDTGDQRAPRQGGADRFLDFVEQELKPLIAKEVHINPQQQALFGHSYGGLLTLHTLFTRPQAFQVYIASSPSIWWNKQFILTEEQAFMAASSLDLSHSRLLLMVGGLEQGRPVATDATAPGNTSTQRRQMVDATRELASRLQQAKPHGLSTFYQLQVGENHGTAMWTGSIRAVEFFMGRSDKFNAEVSQP
ncbi:alpha/beta hydrolase [Methylobacillus methanolivorans]|uniref:Alpha/beta hydrolase n=1 Tax=Methylobacillus methanolivorans TaxID=1848927 RepID=A0ABW8GIR5_9PROT